jgi:hypothetical protein
MKRRVSLLLVVLATWVPQPVYADNWQAFTGAEALHEFVSDASAEIELRPGVTALGSYYADGTAKIVAWGETFDRTWEVVGEDKVCYSALTETNCYTFERNLDVPGDYRARHVESGEVTVFHITGTDEQVATRDAETEAKGGLGSPSAEEIAAQMSNPNSNLGTMSMLFNYVTFDGDIPGADSQSAFQGVFQPSLPYALSPTTNLFVRPAIPVIFRQDVPSPDGGFESEGVDLGDISFDASLLKSSSTGGAVYGGGIVGSIPTATNDALGLDQWLLGPEAIGAIIRKWGVVGALVFHQWDVAGNDDFNTSITGGQLFYIFNLKDGWQVLGTPVLSYNHEADSGNEWTVPLGLGLSKTAIINGRPWQFGLEYQYYVVSPDQFGPKSQLQFSVSPVVALPW